MSADKPAETPASAPAASENEATDSSKQMAAWEINSFGQDLLTTVQLNTKAPMPTIRKPNQLIVKIKAASINPIDTYNVRGYGGEVIHILREMEKGRSMASILCRRGQKFPIILGRDFSGIVHEVGADVTEFKVGDEVYGAIEAKVNGSHAEYALVYKDWVQLKPDTLTWTEAASIPFVALTTWSAMRNAGNFREFTDKRFLILGGSGGVGTIAIQYLHAKGAKITTTCSADALDKLKELGADFVIDYKDPELEKKVEEHGPYDCIYDLAGGLEKSKNLLRFSARGGKFITLTFSGVKNLDNYGLVGGVLKSGFDLASANLTNRPSIKWGVFSADPVGWKELSELVNEGKIKPVVEQVYKFSELPQAYERLDKGHLRGKIVVQVDSE